MDRRLSFEREVKSKNPTYPIKEDIWLKKEKQLVKQLAKLLVSQFVKLLASQFVKLLVSQFAKLLVKQKLAEQLDQRKPLLASSIP